MKQTITNYYCDFSTQVPQHAAGFVLKVEEKTETLDGDDIHACETHVTTMELDLFRTGARQVVVKLLKDVEMGQTLWSLNTAASVKKHRCEDHDIDYKSLSGYTSHMDKNHPGWREATGWDERPQVKGAKMRRVG